MKRSSVWKLMITFCVFFWAAVGTMAHADTFIKMRIAGQGHFFISETNHNLFMVADGETDVHGFEYVQRDQWGNDVYLSEDKSEFVLMNSNSKSQYIEMAGIDTKSAKVNFKFKLDKRYVDEIELK